MLKLLYDFFFMYHQCPQIHKNEYKAVRMGRQSQSISNKICGYIYFAVAVKKYNNIFKLHGKGTYR